MIRVLLADDHALLRSGFRMLLEELPDVQVVAEVGDGVELLERLEGAAPDLLFLDISMPRLGGLEVLAELRERFPGVRVVMLSMHGERSYISRSLEGGALGYMLKDADTAELARAIQTVMSGDTYLCGRCRALLEAEEHDPLERLTPRQREVLRLVALGFSTKEVAERLNISVKTAESHRTQLMQALDIHNVAGLVHFALRVGLIDSQV